MRAPATNLQRRPTETAVKRIAYGSGRARRIALLIALALASSGCTGTLESPARPGGTQAQSAARGVGSAGGAGPRGAAASGSGDGALDPPGGPASVFARCSSEAVGPSPLRRLTHREYDHAVRDLLSDASRPAEAFAPDTQSELFDRMAT